MFLGAYVTEVTKRNNIKIWPGECHVHAGITDKDINLMLQKYSKAEFLVHPECRELPLHYTTYLKGI